MNPLPQREILANLPPFIITGTYVLFGICIAWIVLWYVKRAKSWFAGWKNPSLVSKQKAAAHLLTYLLSHRKLKRDPYAMWMHGLLFWGFVILFIATTVVALQHYTGWVFLTGTFYLWFSLFADLGGLAFCVGILMALWRRRSPTHRIQVNKTTTLVLYLLLTIGLTGFALEGARIAKDLPTFERWSPVGYLFALALSALDFGGDSSLSLHLSLWIGHAILVGAFFAVIPVTILRHIFLAPYSVAHPASRLGVLPQPNKRVTGEISLSDFRRIDLLQSDACLTCGMCTEVCPAQHAGKPLSPRSVVQSLRAYLDRPQDPATKYVTDDALWSCTTCNACDCVCPIHIQIVDKIVALRRGRIAQAKIPTTAVEALENIWQKFNPFGQPNSTRMEWASGLNVPIAKQDEPIELLYWVGCSGAFDPDGREVAKAMVKIFQHLKIYFKVLGCRETCCSDPARRLGEEGLWKALAKQNQKIFQSHKVKTILTTCPHCFNTFKNEYPQLGTMPQVIHHSQWLSEKIKEGALRVGTSTKEKVTFHDPCYLGRVNSEITAPRAVLDTIYKDSRIEMKAHGKESFCCGGGGGQLWLDVRGKTRVETLRALQVEQTKAKTVATGCIFCKGMLEAGRTNLGEGKGNWRVKDIAELVVENMGVKS